MPANGERPVPEFSVSHPAWCSPQACQAYSDHDGKAIYVVHAAIFNGRANYIAALSQREVFGAAGCTMELDEAYVTIRCNGVEELHLPAGQARIAGEEQRGEVGVMVLIALDVLNRAS